MSKRKPTVASFLYIFFSNYLKRVTREYKNEVSEVNKASNVADQDSDKPSSFVGKERER